MKKQPISATLQNLFRFCKVVSVKRRIQISFLFALMIATSFIEIVSIGALFPFLAVMVVPEKTYQNKNFSSVIKIFDLNGPNELLPLLATFFCIAVLVAGFMRMGLMYFQSRMSELISVDFSVEAYVRTLYQPYEYHINMNSSQLITGINKAGELGNMLVSPFLIFLSSVIMIITILSTLIAINPLVALSIFSGISIIYLLITLITKTRLSIDGERLSRESENMLKTMQEGLGSIRDVIIDANQETYARYFRQSIARLRRASANINIINSCPRFLIEAFGMLLIILIAYTLATSSEGLQSAIPVLGVLALGMQRMLPVLQQAYSSLITLQSYRYSSSDALKMLERPIARENSGIETPINFSNGISFNNITYRYESYGRNILDEINLFIPKGARIGIIGETGGGKSTLLDIFLGLLKPISGNLSVDGVRIDENTMLAWQKKIAHVPQTIFLIDSSIAENIALGTPLEKIDFDRIQSVARQAKINTVIDGWEEKYLTKVGERGVKLSGGQRQRVGIARALYKNAEIIVFDEATSALDSKTEEELMQSIESLGKEITILMIAHRITTLQNCTQIIELANGKIIRMGKYEDFSNTRYQNKNA